MERRKSFLGTTTAPIAIEPEPAPRMILISDFSFPGISAYHEFVSLFEIRNQTVVGTLQRGLRTFPLVGYSAHRAAPLAVPVKIRSKVKAVRAKDGSLLVNGRLLQ